MQALLYGGSDVSVSVGTAVRRTDSYRHRTQSQDTRRRRRRRLNKPRHPFAYLFTVHCLHFKTKDHVTCGAPMESPHRDWARFVVIRSHTRTVVRERFKGNKASQWKRQKFDLSPLQNPLGLTDLHNNWQA